MRVKAREPYLRQRWSYLASNFVFRVFTRDDHSLRTILEETKDFRESPTFIHLSESSFITEVFNSNISLLRFLEQGSFFSGYAVEWESYWHHPEVDFDRGRARQKSQMPIQSFMETFNYEIYHSKCIFTDGFKTPGAEFSGFSVVTNRISMHRTAGFFSTFSIEAMAILEALILCQDLDHSTFSIFTDSASVLSALESPFHFTKSSHLISYIRKTIIGLVSEGK